MKCAVLFAKSASATEQVICKSPDICVQQRRVVRKTCMSQCNDQHIRRLCRKCTIISASAKSRYLQFAWRSELTFDCFWLEQVCTRDVWKRHTCRINEGKISQRNEDWTYQGPSMHREIVRCRIAVRAVGWGLVWESLRYSIGTWATQHIGFLLGWHDCGMNSMRMVFGVEYALNELSHAHILHKDPDFAALARGRGDF